MASQPDADFVAVQTALAGEYSLDREIGRGGMGVVYLAREVRLARPVAIKVLPPALAQRTDMREAFLREAQMAAGLNHPNIVPVLAAGEREGFVYIVMSYVDGITLGERIRTRGPLLPGQAARVLREVAWALAYAHGARIVHRDVSAENILLERGTERAIVTDFGLASVTQTSAVGEDGQVRGNAHYISPEQAAGEPVDARSDLYSLGVVGYYALTGRLPFDGVTSAEVVAQHLSSFAPSIVSVAGSVPPRLAAAVERCLHKAPIRRYRNAESFAEAIDLAFEHARDIPVALRWWISQSERSSSATSVLLVVAAVMSVSTFVSTRTGDFSYLRFLLSLLPTMVLGSLALFPTLGRLRTVLREGFILDDLYAALREHQLVRSEEMEYEWRRTSPQLRKTLRWMTGIGAVGTAAGVILHFAIPGVGVEVGALSAMPLFIGGVPLAGEYIRHRLATRMTTMSVSFWKGKMAARIAKLASIGLEPAERPVLGMPVLTEIALGRATDLLFNALPKATRKELASLPGTVRQLESDASKLRGTIGALDDQLAAFERGAESLAGDERSFMASELNEQRVRAAQRLAATVLALENIRLDLLRLQMGTANVQSVTSSLDAAQRVGEQIALASYANDEVESMLRDHQDSPQVEFDSLIDDGSDTPVGGVPTAVV